MNVLLLVLLVVCGSVSQLEGVTVATNFKKVFLIDPSAVCNDGSAAVYYYRAGSGSGASLWSIYLEGGGNCYDVPTCKSRMKATAHFMSSNYLPDILNDTTVSPDVNHGGINSGDPTINPHFYNANQVYLWYCSSDNHAGNVSASQSTGGFQFRGKVIVQDLINDLIQKYRTSLSQATQVLLVGFSAGAHGVINNADFVGDMLKNIVPLNSFKAYIDSGWIMDVPMYSPQDLNSRYITNLLYQNWNVVSDASCMAFYGRIGEKWRCNFPIYAYPFLSTPYYVAGYQTDAPYMNDVTFPLNVTSAEYVSLLRRNFLMETDPILYLFSPNCFCHGNAAFDNRFNVISIGSTTVSDALWVWVNSPFMQPTKWIDYCQGINCNPTCDC